MNVKVTATLGSPLVVGGDGYAPSLDSIVEAAVARKQRTISEASGGRHSAKSRGADIDSPGQLWSPFERVRHDRWVVPRVSDGILSPCKEGVEYIAKRFPLERGCLLNEKERQTKVNLTGGEFKGWHLPLRTLPVERVVWFAVLRSREALRHAPRSILRKLLRDIHSIGKKTAHGYGRVLSWTVEEAEQDWSWYAASPSGKVLMRRLPVALAEENTVGWRPWFGGCCPPYWERRFFTEIVVPC